MPKREPFGLPPPVRDLKHMSFQMKLEAAILYLPRWDWSRWPLGDLISAPLSGEGPIWKRCVLPPLLSGRILLPFMQQHDTCFTVPGKKLRSLPILKTSCITSQNGGNNCMAKAKERKAKASTLPVLILRLTCIQWDNI